MRISNRANVPGKGVGVWVCPSLKEGSPYSSAPSKWKNAICRVGIFIIHNPLNPRDALLRNLSRYRIIATAVSSPIARIHPSGRGLVEGILQDLRPRPLTASVLVRGNPIGIRRIEKNSTTTADACRFDDDPPSTQESDVGPTGRSLVHREPPVRRRTVQPQISVREQNIPHQAHYIAAGSMLLVRKYLSFRGRDSGAQYSTVEQCRIPHRRTPFQSCALHGPYQPS